MNNIFSVVENILLEAGIDEYKAEAKLIILSLSNMSFEDILIGNKIENYDEIILVAKKRANTKAPIQHILGFSYFMSRKFYVDKNVLIPRDETEILVRSTVDILKTKQNKIDILDIGTGSGIIPVSILNNIEDIENIEILAVDISTDALQVALKNILSFGYEKKILIRKSDIFSKVRDKEKFDIIVSNPPYIPLKDKQGIDNIVLDFEPHNALFANDSNGIEFYEKIIQNSKKFLKHEGFILFELGINQAKLVEKLLEKDFKNIKITKDLAGIERVIQAQIQ